MQSRWFSGGGARLLYAGLVQEGEMYYNAMTITHFLSPSLEHYACMVDLWGSAGQLDKAILLIENLTAPDRLRPLSILMACCQKWVNVELGRWAFEHSKQLNEKNAAIYICMSNIYAAAGLQKEADKVEALGMENGAFKISGDCRWISDNRNMHTFTVAV